MAGEISDDELGKRLSAGRGYARESAAQFAQRLGVNRNDLRDWELGRFGSPTRFRATARKREEAVAKVQAATGLPAVFFSVDFNDLPAMAETWRRLDEEDAAEALRLVEEADRADRVPEQADEQSRGPHPKTGT